MGFLNKYKLPVCCSLGGQSVWNKRSSVLWSFSQRFMFFYFVNELNCLIILVQVRGEKRSISDILTWSLSSLQGDRAEKPVPDLTAASSPKSSADTSVSGCWLTLTQMYKEPHRRTRVLGFCYLKTRENLLPCSSFVQGVRCSPFPKMHSSLSGRYTVFRQQTGCFLVCRVCFQR